MCLTGKTQSRREKKNNQIWIAYQNNWITKYKRRRRAKENDTTKFIPPPFVFISLFHSFFRSFSISNLCKWDKFKSFHLCVHACMFVGVCVCLHQNIVVTHMLRTFTPNKNFYIYHNHHHHKCYPQWFRFSTAHSLSLSAKFYSTSYFLVHIIVIPYLNLFVLCQHNSILRT